jgi:putative transposase
MQMVHAEYPSLSMRTLCRWLGISRSWYYAQPAVGAQAEAEGDATALRDASERIVLDCPGYGYRRVTQALRRSGWGPVNHKRVLRVMREEALWCQLKRHFVMTTDSTHGYRTYPNLLADATLDRLDQAWVADSTSIRLPTTFVYLACLLEACSRRCIGWKLARQIDTRLTLAALEMALDLRQPRHGLIHHSDRGVQDASTEYVSRLEAIGARVHGCTGEQVGHRQSLRQRQSRELLQDLETRDGLITNDKFCFIRSGRLTLSWRRTGPRRREDTPVERQAAGGRDATEAPTGMANSSQHRTRQRRTAPLGSRLSTPPAVGSRTGGQ